MKVHLNVVLHVDNGDDLILASESIWKIAINLNFWPEPGSHLIFDPKVFMPHDGEGAFGSFKSEVLSKRRLVNSVDIVIGPAVYLIPQCIYSVDASWIVTDASVEDAINILDFLHDFHARREYEFTSTGEDVNVRSARTETLDLSLCINLIEFIDGQRKSSAMPGYWYLKVVLPFPPFIGLSIRVANRDNQMEVKARAIKFEISEIVYCIYHDSFSVKGISNFRSGDLGRVERMLELLEAVRCY